MKSNSKRTLLYSTLISTLLSWSVCHANAEPLVVVASSEFHLEKLSKSQLINIYMGRKRNWGNDVSITPYDLTNSESGKTEFYKLLLNKELAEINSYWARLMFSGRTTPPHQLENYEQIVSTISSSTSSIGYIPVSAVTEDMKVLFRFD